MAADLDLDFQDGSLRFEGFGYTGRFADVWGPQPQVRRTVGDAVWHAAWLRGGGAGGDGSDAGFADVLEGGVAGVAGDVAEDDGVEEALSSVEELGSDTVDDVAELFDDRGVVPGAGAVTEDGAAAA